MLRVLSISADGFSLTFLCPNLKKPAEGSLAYGDFIQGRSQPFFFPFKSELQKSRWSKEATGVGGDLEDIIGSHVNADL